MEDADSNSNRFRERMPWLKAAQTVWNLIPAPELHSGNLLSMLCRVVHVTNSERQRMHSGAFLQAGWNRGN
mgnify:CR=1 FL=1